MIARAIVLVALAATLVVFLAIDRNSHSVSDTFYGMVVPEGVVLVVAALALAAARRFGRRPA